MQILCKKLPRARQIRTKFARLALLCLRYLTVQRLAILPNFMMLVLAAVMDFDSLPRSKFSLYLEPSIRSCEIV